MLLLWYYCGAAVVLILPRYPCTPILLIVVVVVCVVCCRTSYGCSGPCRRRCVCVYTIELIATLSHCTVALHGFPQTSQDCAVFPWTSRDCGAFPVISQDCTSDFVSAKSLLNSLNEVCIGRENCTAHQAHACFKSISAPQQHHNNTTTAAQHHHNQH